MSIIDFPSSPQGRAAAAAALAVLTLLTLAMTIRLRKRHRAYRLLPIGIAAALLAQLPAMYPAAADAAIGPAAALLAADSMRALSFIIINAAALELYCRPRRLDRLLLFLPAALLPAALSLSALPLSASADTLLPPGGLALPAVHASAVLAAVLFLAVTLPRVGQQRTYGIGLTAYLVAQLARLAADLSGSQPPGALTAVPAVLELLYALTVFLFVFESVLERLKTVYTSSIRDGLTGLYTRQHFLRKAERYLSRGFKVSVLFCDIDNFKRLNDTEGHQRADDVLKRVAAILEEETRGVGTAGRYGGEELVAAVVQPASKPGAVAESVRKRVEAETPATVSIGWSTVAADGSLGDAIKNADEAMYKSKNTGKNKVTAHREPPAPRSSAASPSADETRELGTRG